jgi:hypothetical protein
MNKRPVLALLLIFSFSVCVRILTAEYVDIGGDNVWRWTSARDFFAGSGFPEWTHHNMRWPIMAPLWVAMELLGTNPVAYYIPPIFFASLGAVFIYLIGKQLHGTECGLVAALLVILFPQMTQAGSQNWPSVYQFAFIAVSIWAVFKWHEEKRTGFLVLAAFGFFLAWGARLTGLYFFPGLVFLVWLPGRNYKAAFIFCLAVGFFLACEWGYFWHDTGNVFGRIGIIKSATGAVDTTSLGDYFLNAFRLSRLRGLLPIYVIILASCVALLRTKDAKRRALALFYLIFIFMFSYMVSGFDPIRLAQDLSRRYWCMVAPIGLLILVVSLYDIKEVHPRFFKGVLAILFAVFIVFSAKQIPLGNAMVQVNNDYAVLAPVFEAKKPVLLKWEPWQPNWVESVAFNVLGVKKNRKESSSSVFRAMIRGGHRALGLYSPTTQDFYDFKGSWLVKQDDLTYLLVFPGNDASDSPEAVITFDRKWARAARLPVL